MINKSAMTQNQAIASTKRLPQSEFFNAAALCQGSNKRVNNYLRTNKVKSLLVVLGKEMGVPIESLVVARKGGMVEDSGTLLHIRLKPDFMKWLELPRNEEAEKEIQSKLHEELGGHREVPHAAGFIDLLTNIELIEVKEVRNWMKGVGQLVVYGQDYPRHKKRLHLFGAVSPSKRGVVENYCTPLKIKITWEDN